MSLEACLPANLRGPSTTITRIAAGLSGAGVYRVEADGQASVLKVSSEDDPLPDWRRRVHFQQLAANAGVAPRVLHVDEARRAVLSALIVDRSFPAFYRDPRTHETALEQLGRVVRRVHQIPLPPDAAFKEPREFLAETWARLSPQRAVPAFVGDAVRRALAEPGHGSGRPLVLSHNDINPSNLVYDGEHILLLDWNVAGPNDPFYDLAAISIFLRMEDTTRRKLLAAYDGAPEGPLPDRFAYNRRLVGALCGSMMLALRQGDGRAPEEEATLESTPSLGEFYQRMRAGQLNVATAEGQWWFGLAIVKESLAP